MEHLRGIGNTMIVLGLLVPALPLSLFVDEDVIINAVRTIFLEEKHALMSSLTGDAELRVRIVERERFKIKLEL
jgi:hypothetical protein